MKKLKNHVIVCGYGRNGYRACEELKNSGKDFVVIESDDEILNTIPDESRFHVISGDATQDEVLQLARIEFADFIITTLPKDSDNVFITLTARGLNPSIQIISRASDLNSERKMKVAGASKVVMPDLLGGYHMAQLITKPYVVEFLEMLNGTSDTSVTLEEIEYEELLPQYREKTVGELHIRAKTGATVIGYKYKDEGFQFNPGPDVTITKDSILIILGTVQTIENLRRVFLKHDEY
ncbi:potassium channel family protein [Bacteroidota bacterium]